MYQFRDDWIDSILNNNDKPESFLDTYNKIKKDIWWRYEKAGLKNKNPLIIIADSYLEEKLMINFMMLASIGGLNQISSQVGDQVRPPVDQQLRFPQGLDDRPLVDP